MARLNDNKLVSLAVLLAVLLISSKAFQVSGKMQIGINLGLMGDNLPSITSTVDLLSNLHAGAVRLYDANPEMLSALSDKPHEVIVSMRNDQLADIATSPDAADVWVETSVVPFYPATKITFIAVGNEVLRKGNVETDGQYLTQALRNVYSALEARNLHDAIKVVSPLSGEILGVSWPPAAGFFDNLQFVVPLLRFLEETGSTFFINLYPYYAHIADNAVISFDFAAFQCTAPAFMDPLSNVEYTNLFESMLDAAYNAMASLGFPDLPLAVGETGWPTDGGHEATVQNAELFNKNLVQHVYSKGTPQRPDVRTPVFIFALFNENQKPGPAPERFWGLLNADGTPVYPIDLADPTLAPDATTTLPPLQAAAAAAAVPADSGFSENPTDNSANPDDVVNAATLPFPATATADDSSPVDPNVVNPADDSTPVNPIDALSDPTAALAAPIWPIWPEAAAPAVAAAENFAADLLKEILGITALPGPLPEAAASPRVGG